MKRQEMNVIEPVDEARDMGSEPAFNKTRGGQRNKWAGLSKRERIAMAFMAGMLSNPYMTERWGNDALLDDAIELADQLLAKCNPQAAPLPPEPDAP